MKFGVIEVLYTVTQGSQERNNTDKDGMIPRSLKQTSLGPLARAALHLHRRSMRNFLRLRFVAVPRSRVKSG